jgi:hypothetical protein
MLREVERASHRRVAHSSSCAMNRPHLSRRENHRIPRLRPIMALSLALTLTLFGCESGSGESPEEQPDPSGATTTTTSQSPSPTPQPKPASPSDALLSGRFDVTYTVVSTNVNFEGFSMTFRAAFVFDPRCAAGPCDGRVTRPGTARVTGFDSKYLFLRPQGRYRWLLRENRAFACGDTPIPANVEYLIRPMKVRLAEDGLTWIVSKFEGSLDEQALKTGGCFPLAEAKWVLRGKLAD